MTEGEKIVWACTYSVQWSRALEKREAMGIPMSVATCIENAHTAVVEMREARQRVLDGWGDGPELNALDEILNDG